MPTHRPSVRWLLGAAVLAAGCGGGGGGSGPGPTATLVKTGGDNQVGPAGQPLAVLEVTVQDASATPLSGITVTWAAASGGGSVNPSNFVTGADGKATTTRTLGPGAGAQTTTGSASGANTVTFAHVAQIQGATQIAASGGAARADSVLSTAPFAVVVRDQNSVAKSGVIVAWSVTGGGGTLSQLVDTTDAGGISTVNLTLTDAAVAHTAQAAVTGLIGSPVAFSDNAVAGNATQMALDGGNAQVGPVSTALPTPHSVIVRDAYGNPKSGFAGITWVVGVGGGSLSTSAPVTNGSGVASVTRTLGSSPGAHSDTAKAASVSGSPVAFGDTAGAVNPIQVNNNFFQPTPDTVAVGTFVRFTWQGGVAHDVTWDNGPDLPANSPLQASGTYTARLTQVGTYAYHCSVHGGSMSGVLVVQ